MPAMRTSVLLALLLLIGLSAPVTADPGPCVGTMCVQSTSPCAPVQFTGGQPALKLWPFLNVVYINLSCVTAAIHT